MRCKLLRLSATKMNEGKPAQDNFAKILSIFCAEDFPRWWSRAHGFANAIFEDWKAPCAGRCRLQLLQIVVNATSRAVFLLIPRKNVRRRLRATNSCMQRARLHNCFFGTLC